MQSLGVFHGSFFKPRPFSDLFPSSTRESAGKQGKESVVRLEDYDLATSTSKLKGRVVGIVKLTDLESCKQENGSYMINKTLKEHLNTTRDIKNLPKDFEKQYVLPFGSGVALSEDLILTAGHNIHTAPGNIRVIQYELEGIRLPTTSVYEVECYVNKQDYFDEDENDPHTYANNLLEGEWAILKLQKPLKGVSGALPVATTINDFVQGVKTFTLGHPYGLPLKKAEGEIDTILQKNHIIRYKAETLPGMSGGPVFDVKTGKLIGLHVRGNINYQFDARGAVEFVVMLPQNPKIEEMGVYGTFFQNVIPVIEKISKSSLTYQPSSFTNTSIKSQSKFELTSEEKEREDRLEKMRAEVEAKKKRIERQKKEKEENEKLRQAREAKEREEKELLEELERLEKEESEMQLQTMLSIENRTTPSNASISSISSHSTSSSKKIVPSNNFKVPVPIIAFGKEKWNEYFGDVGEEPPLPANIQSILDSPCPFWPKKKIGETHFLVLIPEKVNGRYLTLNYLGELIQKPEKGTATKYENYWDKIKNEYGEKSIGKSYWMMITKDVLLGTRNCSYAEQQKILSKVQGYEVPSTLDAAISILMEYVSTGKTKYSSLPSTYTRCQEKCSGTSYQNIVGGLGPKGFSVNYIFGDKDGDNYGLSASRKFESNAQICSMKNEEKQIQPQMVLPSAKRTTLSNPPISLISSTSTSSSTKIDPSMNFEVPVPIIAFGKEKWEEYFGNVGEEPPLPANIQSILDSPCPFWPKKKIGETHFLVLIPEKVNGQYLTLNYLGELIQKPKKGTATKYEYYWDKIKNEYGEKRIGKSYWMMITKDVLLGTRNCSYAEQQKILSKVQGYEVPSTLDAAISILMEYVSIGKTKYSSLHSTYTRCQEKCSGTSYHNIVGGLGPKGFSVNYIFGDKDGDNYGLSASRKFESNAQISSMENEEKQIQPQMVLPSEKPTIPLSIVGSSAPFSLSSSSIKIASLVNEIDSIPAMAFGKAKWEEYFGDVGKEPPLPRDIENILDSTCPFWPEKKVRDSHMLILIPQKVNGEYLTLSSLEKLVQKPKKGTATKYNQYWDDIKSEFGDKIVENSYWILMTRDVLPGTRRRSYQDQWSMLLKAKDYKVPKTLEAAVTILMEFISTGKTKYCNDPWTGTRCQEKCADEVYHNVVGGLDSSGLCGRSIYSYDHEYNGLAALRKL